MQQRHFHLIPSQLSSRLLIWWKFRNKRQNRFKANVKIQRWLVILANNKSHQRKNAILKRLWCNNSSHRSQNMNCSALNAIRWMSSADGTEEQDVNIWKLQLPYTIGCYQTSWAMTHDAMLAIEAVRLSNQKSGRFSFEFSWLQLFWQRQYERAIHQQRGIELKRKRTEHSAQIKSYHECTQSQLNYYSFLLLVQLLILFIVAFILFPRSLLLGFDLLTFRAKMRFQFRSPMLSRTSRSFTAIELFPEPNA